MHTDPAIPSDWPWLARLVSQFRKPEDAGLGDTVHRLLASVGADAVKRIYTALTGSSCGCQHRQDLLNQRFPYRP